jgi:hypothetical protein
MAGRQGNARGIACDGNLRGARHQREFPLKPAEMAAFPIQLLKERL